MEIRRIALNGWRNYDFASAEFSPGTNVISGENAQGKTNLLEAPEKFWRTSLRTGASRP